MPSQIVRLATGGDIVLVPRLEERERKTNSGFENRVIDWKIITPDWSVEGLSIGRLLVQTGEAEHV